jgi:Xaa-Pro aminopeptidase
MGPLDQIVDLGVDGVRVSTYGDFYWHTLPQRDLEPGDRYIAHGARTPRPGIDGIHALAEVLVAQKLETGRLGIDERGFSPQEFTVLQDLVPAATLVPAYALFRELRAVKSPAEVEKLETVARLTEDAIHTALAIAAPGVTEREMARVVASEMAKKDAIPLMIALGFGPKSAHPNSIPTDRPLRAGDVIRFDVGARCDGYHSDLARVGSLGEPNRELAHLYDAMLAGQQAALDALRPGVAVRDLFEVGMRAARDAGAPHYVRHHIGHGIGLEFYDEPVITGRSTWTIEPGMVINIETPIYELGLGGVQTEDTVVVIGDGFRFLTSGQRPWYRV